VIKFSIIGLSGLMILAIGFNLVPPRLGFSAVAVLALMYLGSIGKTVFNPLYWVWAPWVFALIPSLTGFLHYRDPPISVDAIGYIFVALVVCSVGVFVFGYSRNSVVSSADRFNLVVASITKNERLISWLAAAGILGASLFAIEMIFIVGATTENLFSLRQQYEARDVSILSRLAPLLVWGSWVSLAAVVIAWQKVGNRQRMLWAISPLFSVLLSLLSAGRQSVFQVLIIISFALLFRYAFEKLYKAGKRQPRLRGKRLGLVPKVLVGSAMLTIVFYMGAIAALRNDARNVLTKSDYLLTVFAAEPDDASREFLDQLPQEIEDSTYEAVIYFSSGVSLFSGLFEISELPQFGGQFTFPWVARRFEAISGQKVTDSMNLRRDLMDGRGYMSHGWSTAFASYILDFGLWGSIAFLLVVGALAGLAFKNFNTHPSFFNLLLVFAANIHFLYMIMLPASSDSVFFFFVIGNMFIANVLHKRMNFVRYRRGVGFGGSHENPQRNAAVELPESTKH